jgi:hypothetical protein
VVTLKVLSSLSLRLTMSLFKDAVSVTDAN